MAARHPHMPKVRPGLALAGKPWRDEGELSTCQTTTRRRRRRRSRTTATTRTTTPPWNHGTRALPLLTKKPWQDEDEYEYTGDTGMGRRRRDDEDTKTKTQRQLVLRHRHRMEPGPCPCWKTGEPLREEDEYETMGKDRIEDQSEKLGLRLRSRMQTIVMIWRLVG